MVYVSRFVASHRLPRLVLSLCVCFLCANLVQFFVNVNFKVHI